MSRSRHLSGSLAAGLLVVGLAACSPGEEPDATASAEPGGGSTETPAAGGEPAEPEATTEEPTEGASAGAADGIPPLDELWPTVIDNADSAESMTTTITGSDGIDATLTGQLDDSNFQVDASVQGAEVSIIGVEDVYYINGDEAFWTAAGGESLAGTMSDRWIETPPGMDVGESLSLSTLWEEFFAEVPTDVSDLQTSSAELTELDGVEAYHYVVEDGQADIWVSADGADHLLRVVIADESGDEDLAMSITDWDDAPPVEAPDDAVPIEDIMGSRR
ncbi:hypothetical protein [Serinicoccus kebangsaanensis]|uniref:hypothetical protein n=1 Tax=Serinicoccus kebangsaanensis TaxID=2602069 RepID=UPI00178C73A1|nr:hypothetical protein [Serinicoccus kebangsaanensis]